MGHITRYAPFLLYQSVPKTLYCSAEKGVGKNHMIYISHADAIKDALSAKEMIEEAIEGAEIEILELSPVFVTQGGPQCVAIQYIEK